MIIKKAKTAGFCFGVKRAVEMVYDHLDRKNLYTYGPIIHNNVVIEELQKNGVIQLDSIEDIQKAEPGTVIIRAHGIPEEEYAIIRESGHQIMDATCPFVLKIHNIVREATNQGCFVIIMGNPKHPEVLGIQSCGAAMCKVSETIEEALEIIDDCRLRNQPVRIVAQTTFNYNKFQELVEICNQNEYIRIDVLNTICSATQERQSEALKLSQEMDAMLVIGDANSSNSQKLFSICKENCKHAFFLERADAFDYSSLGGFHQIGITAGASTPNIIIEEVQKRMSDFDFEQMLDASLKTIHNGEVVDGKVIAVKEDEIILNIGYKSDAIITRNEYTSTPGVDLRTVVNEGDEITAKVIRVNDGDGYVQLSSKRLAAEAGNKRLEEAFNNEEVLTAKVAQVLEGGLSVVVEETKVFIPASLVSDVYEKDLTKYAGQEIQFVITEFNPRKRRIIGNRKVLVAAEKAKLREEVMSKIEVGQVVEGTVKNVTDFGVFVDIGGVDGLLHVSEISWGRVESPKKKFHSGDAVKAFIKEINGDRIALSLKFDNENPWLDAENKFAIGNVVTGKVARMTDFGAFIELEAGVDALLHVSQIAREHINKPSDVLKVNQEIEAKIVDLNVEDHKISLSMKALLPEEAPVEEVPAEEVPVEEAPVEEAPAEVATEEVVSEETASEE